MKKTSEPIISLINKMKQYFQSSPTELNKNEEFEDFENEEVLSQDPSSCIILPDIKSMIFNLQGLRSGNFEQIHRQLSIQLQQQDQNEIFQSTQCTWDESDFSLDQSQQGIQLDRNQEI